MCLYSVLISKLRKVVDRWLCLRGEMTDGVSQTVITVDALSIVSHVINKTFDVLWLCHVCHHTWMCDFNLWWLSRSLLQWYQWCSSFWVARVAQLKLSARVWIIIVCVWSSVVCGDSCQVLYGSVTAVMIDMLWSCDSCICVTFSNIRVQVAVGLVRC